MLARLLFASVWLIIAAGLLLPLYPLDVAAPRLTAVMGPETLAGAAGCKACPAATAQVGDCAGACSCGRRRGVGAAAAPVCVDLQLHLVIQPAPAAPPARPRSLPQKLPAI